jgi:hypothetical protein
LLLRPVFVSVIHGLLLLSNTFPKDRSFEMTLMLRAALLSAGALLSTSSLACDIAGTWTGPATFIGRMADRGTRTLTINVAADCSYQWSVPGVVQTVGKASAGWSAGSFSYRNEAGSIGSMDVSKQGARQTMKIVQSQGNYTAELTKRGR